MMANKLLRKSSDRIIAGVCGGVAEYFGWDPTWVRIVYVVLTICTAFSGVLLYIVAALIMPDNNHQLQ